MTLERVFAGTPSAEAMRFTRLGPATSSQDFLFDSEDEDLAIKPDDTVTIFRADNPQIERHIKVTNNVSDLGKGLVSMIDDFGAALIGAIVGEHVVIRSAGKVPQTYVVKEIHRSCLGPGATDA